MCKILKNILKKISAKDSQVKICQVWKLSKLILWKTIKLYEDKRGVSNFTKTKGAQVRKFQTQRPIQIFWHLQWSTHLLSKNSSLDYSCCLLLRGGEGQWVLYPRCWPCSRGCFAKFIQICVHDYHHHSSSNVFIWCVYVMCNIHLLLTSLLLHFLSLTRSPGHIK